MVMEVLKYTGNDFPAQKNNKKQKNGNEQNTPKSKKQKGGYQCNLCRKDIYLNEKYLQCSCKKKLCTYCVDGDQFWVNQYNQFSCYKYPSFPAVEDKLRKHAILNNLSGGFSWNNPDEQKHLQMQSEQVIFESRIKADPNQRSIGCCKPGKQQPAENPLNDLLKTEFNNCIYINRLFNNVLIRLNLNYKPITYRAGDDLKTDQKQSSSSPQMSEVIV